MNLIHSMQIKVIGGYINCNEMMSKEDAGVILSHKLEEALFESTTHRAIVRAINKVKESGAEICDLNILSFLELKGMPRTVQEGNEILEVMAEYAITPKSFQNYIKALRVHRSSKVSV